MRRPRARGVACAFSIFLFGLPGCSGEPSADARPDGPPQAAKAVPVVVIRPERSTIDDVFLEREASLLPIVVTTVASQQEGVIMQVYPEVGDVVHEGDAIVQMDESDYRLILDERRAELKKAEVTLTERERSWARVEELFEKKIISEDERDGQRLALENARADVDLARARAARAEQDLRSLRIFAPFPAVVAAIHSDVGSYVQRGDAILDLKRVDWIIALCTVNERDLRFVQEGGSVRVTLPAYPGRLFDGLIWKIVPDALVGSRSFPVKILLQNTQIELKSGMSARVEFVRRVEDALLVPKDAVVYDGEQPTVWIAREGKAERRAVELGAAFGDRWHVREGLGVEDAVIVTGNEFLEPDASVEIGELPSEDRTDLPEARERPVDAGASS